MCRLPAAPTFDFELLNAVSFVMTVGDAAKLALKPMPRRDNDYFAILNICNHINPRAHRTDDAAFHLHIFSAST
ncbi:hypothetical protein D4A92_08945 [Rhizobium rosettiformans]|uniref:DUF982 domain-containing protein n=1 Tax=Rhizobium rosettiformans TaxID=1368430 RepID=A0ABX7ETG7_9HYPH|nr:hypothetical protein D4A92_08945 [Rhizobium rosettiformans]